MMRKYSKSDFRVGQELFVVMTDGSRSQSSEMVAITKVGRKWLVLGEGWNSHRAEIETLRLDGGQYSSPGCAYLTQDDYETKLRLQAGWGGIQSRIHRYSQPPDGLTDGSLADLTRVLDGIFGEVT